MKSTWNILKAYCKNTSKSRESVGKVLGKYQTSTGKNREHSLIVLEKDSTIKVLWKYQESTRKNLKSTWNVPQKYQKAPRKFRESSGKVHGKYKNSKINWKVMGQYEESTKKVLWKHKEMIGKVLRKFG